MGLKVRTRANLFYVYRYTSSLTSWWLFTPPPHPHLLWPNMFTNILPGNPRVLPFPSVRYHGRNCALMLVSTTLNTPSGINLRPWSASHQGWWLWTQPGCIPAAVKYVKWNSRTDHLVEAIIRTFNVIVAVVALDFTFTCASLQNYFYGYFRVF